MELREYTDGVTLKEARHLTEEVYRAAMTSLIIVCVDVLLINKARKSVYLAKRIVDPLPIRWMIGGRLRKGESASSGIVRKCLEETGIEFSPERFSFLAMHRYILGSRKQEPVEEGSDSLAYTFVLEPTKEELEQMAMGLDKNEYSIPEGFMELTLQELAENNIHTAIIDLAKSALHNESV